MTRAEALAFNAGVEAMIEIARTSADRIALSSPRPVASGAVEALSELAEAGRALLLLIEPEREPR